MSRKGQVTILVIVGIVILIGVLSVFYFTSDFKGFKIHSVNDVTDMTHYETIDSLVSKCVKDVVTDTDQEIISSRFYFAKKNPVFISPDDLPYFYFSGKILLPKLDYVQDEYAKRITPLISECLDNFSIIRPKLEQEIRLSSDDFLSVKVFIGEDAINVESNFDGGLYDSSGRKDIPENVVSVPSKVGTFYYGSQLLLYPPIEGNESFFEPADNYLKEKGISLYGRPSGDGIEMAFTMEEKELPADRDYKLRMSFRLLGSFLDSLSWV